MKPSRIRDLLVELFPGRSVSVQQDNWYHSEATRYTKHTCSIFKTNEERTLDPADTASIVVRVEDVDVRCLFIRACKKMFEYEQKIIERVSKAADEPEDND